MLTKYGVPRRGEKINTSGSVEYISGGEYIRKYVDDSNGENFAAHDTWPPCQVALDQKMVNGYVRPLIRKWLMVR